MSFDSFNSDKTQIGQNVLNDVINYSYTQSEDVCEFTNLQEDYLDINDLTVKNCLGNTLVIDQQTVSGDKNYCTIKHTDVSNVSAAIKNNIDNKCKNKLASFTSGASQACNDSSDLSTKIAQATVHNTDFSCIDKQQNFSSGTLDNATLSCSKLCNDLQFLMWYKQNYPNGNACQFEINSVQDIQNYNVNECVNTTLINESLKGNVMNDLAAIGEISNTGTNIFVGILLVLLFCCLVSCCFIGIASIFSSLSGSSGNGSRGNGGPTIIPVPV